MYLDRFFVCKILFRVLRELISLLSTKLKTTIFERLIIFGLNGGWGGHQPKLRAKRVYRAAAREMCVSNATHKLRAKRVHRAPARAHHTTINPRGGNYAAPSIQTRPSSAHNNQPPGGLTKSSRGAFLLPTAIVLSPSATILSPIAAVLSPAVAVLSPAAAVLLPAAAVLLSAAAVSLGR